MHFLASTPNITPITDLILTWTHIGQALVGSIGALAFIFALACRSSNTAAARLSTTLVLCALRRSEAPLAVAQSIPLRSPGQRICAH